MAVYTAIQERLSVWPNSFNISKEISVLKGDLIIISVMVNGASFTPSGFTQAGAGNNGLQLYFRVADKKETFTFSIGSAGQLHYTIMRSDKGIIKVKRYSNNTNSSAYTIANKGQVTVFSTTGSSASPFSSAGWSKIYSQTSWSGDDYYNLARKAFDGDITIPAHNIWTQDAYLIVEEGPDKTADLEIAYSTDNIVYSSFQLYDPLKIPQARFLKFRATLSGGEQVGEKSVFEFDQLNAETKLTLGEFIENIQTNLQPKTIYTKQMTEDTSYTEEGARLFESSIKKSEFKKIIKMTLK